MKYTHVRLIYLKPRMNQLMHKVNKIERIYHYIWHRRRGDIPCVPARKKQTKDEAGNRQDTIKRKGFETWA